MASNWAIAQFTLPFSAIIESQFQPLIKDEQERDKSTTRASKTNERFFLCERDASTRLNRFTALDEHFRRGKASSHRPPILTRRSGLARNQIVFLFYRKIQVRKARRRKIKWNKIKKFRADETGVNGLWAYCTIPSACSIYVEKLKCVFLSLPRLTHRHCSRRWAILLFRVGMKRSARTETKRLVYKNLN